MNEKLQNFTEVLGSFQNTYPEDACLVLFDTEKVIAYLPGKEIDLQIHHNDPLSTFPVSEEAFEMGRHIREEKGAERFGFPYVASAEPIYDGEKLIGILTAVVSNKKLDVLRSSAANLSSVIEQVSATSDQIAQVTNDIALTIQSLAERSNALMEDVKKIDDILSFVQDVAIQSNLLGLNAAIEAAKAGEHGKGFSVVADEIRKMSADSKQAVKNIKLQIKEIVKSNEQINEDIQQIAANIEQHSASVQEMNSAFAHIAHTSEELLEAAHV